MLGALLAALLAAPAAAQELASVSASRARPAPAGDGEVAFTSLAAQSMTPPIKLIPERWVLVNGLSFSWLRAAGDAASPWLGDDPVDLYTAQWQAINLVSITERFKAVGVVIPGLFGRDLQTQAVALALWVPRDGLAFGARAGWLTTTGAPPLVPMLQATAEGERLALRATLPERLELGFEVLDDRLLVGARGGLTGGFYRWGDDEPSLLFSQSVIGPALELHLGPAILRAEGGWAFYRNDCPEDLPDCDVVDSEALGVGPSALVVPLDEATAAVRSQGSRGTCVSFGLNGAAEVLLGRQQGVSDLSEQNTYFLGKLISESWCSSICGHEVLAIGYRDDPDVQGGGFVVLKDSWDSSWGDDGLAYATYEWLQYSLLDAHALVSIEAR